MRAPTAIAAGLAILLAGCLSATEDAVQPASGPSIPALADAVAGLAGDLPCEVADIGAADTENVREVAKNALDASGYGSAAELWIHGNTAFVARYQTGGFNIVDVSDPLHPVEVAAWDPETADRGLDVKSTADGTGVLVGGDRGIKLIDVRDPADPRLEAEAPFEKPQAHMLTTFTVAGVEYVGAAKGNGQDFPIYRIEGEPGARTLELVSSPKVTLSSFLTQTFVPEDLARTHDAFFFDDPLLGKPTIWFANPWDGLSVYDVSDPTKPAFLAHVPNLKPQYTHTVQTVVVDGKRYTVSVAEVGVNTMKVYDTTDLADPRLLSEWSVRNPAQPQHNLQVLPPYIYVAHYAEGVLVFDFDKAIAGTLTPMARLASTGGAPASSSLTVRVLGATGFFNGVWDVNVKDGLLYVTDGALRVAAFGCVTPGDATVTSVG